MKHIENMKDVASIDCRIETFDWPFPREEAARIDRHWSALRAEKPALFDGRVLLSHRLSVEQDGQNDALVGGSFEVGYKSFLSWRDFGFPGVPVANVFAMPALRAADGAFMVGRMSRGTANAGRLYFPAGTPEPGDAGPDGRVDFEANILRELEEETGFAPDDVELDPTWTIVFAGPLVACMKIARSPLSAAELQRRAAAFIETQAHPELDFLLPVRSQADLDTDSMPPFMLRYLSSTLTLPRGQAR